MKYYIQDQNPCIRSDVPLEGNWEEVDIPLKKDNTEYSKYIYNKGKIEFCKQAEREAKANLVKHNVLAEIEQKLVLEQAKSVLSDEDYAIYSQHKAKKQ